MMSFLHITGVVKRFGGVAAVADTSFQVRQNSITALIGPNGAGKTTMFDLISGFSRPDEGQILFRGQAIEALPAYARARLGMARTFQAVRVFPALTVLDNLLLALPAYPDGLVESFFARRRELNRLREQAHELLALVKLEKTRSLAGSLSYGQQKLLEIVRAAATGADLLLFDEPAAGVNRTLLHEIIALFKKLQHEGKTILLVEHDMGFVMGISEHVIVMDYGKKIAEGRPSEVQRDPKVLEAYLGIK